MKRNRTKMKSTINKHSEIVPQIPLNQHRKYIEDVDKLVDKLYPPRNCEWSNLCEQIWKKFEENEQTASDLKIKITVWRFLNNFFKTYIKKSELYMVGSSITGLASNESDMDFTILESNKKMYQPNGEKAVKVLSSLRLNLSKMGNLKNVQLSKKRAQLMMRDVASEIDIDVNYDGVEYIRNSYLLRLYAKADWRVKPMIIVIKLWAFHHKLLCHAFSGFHLALLVINFLQCGTEIPVLPNIQHLLYDHFKKLRYPHTIDFADEVKIPFKSENVESLGYLFIEFFRYYSKFDFSENVIVVRKANSVPIEAYSRHGAKPEFCKQFRKKYMCIEEPFAKKNVTNDITEDTFKRFLTALTESFLTLNETHKLNSIFPS